MPTAESLSAATGIPVIMASTTDILRSGIAQQKAGGKLDSDTISGAASTSSTNYSTDNSEEYVTAGESTTDESPFPSASDSDSTQETADSIEALASKTGNSEGKSPPKTSADREVLTITDERGKRKVEVDFSDRESLKKHVQMAFGARKWQAERDQARGDVAKAKEQLTGLQSNWKALEDAYSSSGIEGLVDLLEGRRGAFSDWEKQRLDRHEFLKKASPEEAELLREREKRTKLEQADVRRQREHDERMRKFEEERTAIDLRAAESKIHPAFDKYRFADKLGDTDAEQMFDEMLWSTAMQRLEPYEEKYGSAMAIPPEVVNQTFRDVAAKVRSRISSQAEKKVARTVEQKKQEAAENVQAKVKSGYKTDGVAKEAAALMNAGNLTGLLKNWSKYRGVFNR